MVFFPLSCYNLINKLCRPTINHKTPYEFLFKEALTFLHIKISGYLTYASTITRHKDKLDPSVTNCLFLGYSHWIKGYIIYNLHPRSTFIYRNCISYEYIFLYTHHITNITPNTHNISILKDNNIGFLFDFTLDTCIVAS